MFQLVSTSFEERVRRFGTIERSPKSYALRASRPRPIST